MAKRRGTAEHFAETTVRQLKELCDKYKLILWDVQLNVNGEYSVKGDIIRYHRVTVLSSKHGAKFEIGGAEIGLIKQRIEKIGRAKLRALQKIKELYNNNNNKRRK